MSLHMVSSCSFATTKLRIRKPIACCSFLSVQHCRYSCYNTAHRSLCTQRLSSSSPVYNRIDSCSTPLAGARSLCLPGEYGNTHRFNPNYVASLSTSRPKMFPKLVPSNPEKVMVIREVCHGLITCSVPFSRFGFIRIGGRGTIIRMESDSIAVFSPVSLTDSVKEAIVGLNGTVKYIIAPNLEHHIFISEWKDAYPDAEIIAPEGLREKREKNPKIKAVKFDHIFTAENKKTLKISDEFQAEFAIEYVHIHPNHEIVLLHKRTKSLIQADMFYNPPAREQYQKSKKYANGGIITMLFNTAMSIRGIPLWQERLIWYVLARKDRVEFRDSILNIDSWEFDRLIPCHGDVVEVHGKRIFQVIFWWFLRGMLYMEPHPRFQYQIPERNRRPRPQGRPR